MDRYLDGIALQQESADINTSIIEDIETSSSSKNFLLSEEEIWAEVEEYVDFEQIDVPGVLIAGIPDKTKPKRIRRIKKED